jgi:hypothetical protein
VLERRGQGGDAIRVAHERLDAGGGKLAPARGVPGGSPDGVAESPQLAGQ